jgi:small subunit ribosomal protein S6
LQTYESILITLPTLTEEEEKTTVDIFESIITDGGGSIDYRDRMGKRRLAYPIMKLDDGVYTRFLYDAESSVVTELERRARLHDKIMRYMTIKLERSWAREAKEKAIEDIQARKDAIVAAEAAAVEAEAKAIEDAAKAAEEAEKAAAEPVEAVDPVETTDSAEATEAADEPVVVAEEANETAEESTEAAPEGETAVKEG